MSLKEISFGRQRIGVLISGNGSTLQSILDCMDMLDVAVVIASKPSAYGILRARRMGVPVEIIPRELRLSTQKLEAEKWISSKLDAYKAQKIFLAGFMRIISENFINKYQDRIFNIHPSLLPKYKGMSAFEETLASSDLVGGVSIHHVAPDVDSGEIILQKDFDIPIHRDEKLSQLLLHINEQRALRNALQRILWQKQLMS
ncbi:MAG: formyltransferase family protein [Oligoflexia bacterium]|nr:formyltransferase family protein [Oligoflexia bacterium]